MSVLSGLKKYKIALLGVSRQELSALNQQLDSMSVVKPLRMFGAVWTSDKVSQRNAVSMCEPCWKRYKGWWKKAHYRPDWGWRYIGDCDGCGTRNIYVTFFNAEEHFYTGLASNHGLNPQP